jgi:hypothetical protein
MLALAPRGARADMLDQFIAPAVPGTDVEPNVTVQSRQRPEYAPLGYRDGPLTLRPELDETVSYDDNATATPHPRGSMLVQTNVDLRAALDESSFAAAANLNVNDNEYLERPNQSYTNWSATLGGGTQFDRDTLTAVVTHQNLNQTVGDLAVPQLSRALPFSLDSFNIAYRADFGRLFVVPALTVSYSAYQNGLVGGAVYAQSYRNHLLYNPTLTVGYKFDRATLVGVLRDAVAQFTGPRDGLAIQDFNDVSALAGIDYAGAELLRYRLLVGYETRSFTSAAYKTISAPIFEGSVIWTPTGLTTVTGQAARRIQDAAVQTTVSLTETAFALSVDHELYRNVLLHASASYANDQYGANEGQQSLVTAGASATYLLDRNLQLSAGYNFTSRRKLGSVTLIAPQATQVGPSYNDDRVFVQLRLAL